MRMEELDVSHHILHPSQYRLSKFKSTFISTDNQKAPAPTTQVEKEAET